MNKRGRDDGTAKAAAIFALLATMIVLGLKIASDASAAEVVGYTIASFPIAFMGMLILICWIEAEEPR